MANNTQLASDNFASGSLAAGWSQWIPTAGNLLPVVIVGSPNVIQSPTLSTAAGVYWTGLTPTNDHVCEVTVNNVAASGNAAITLGVRLQTDGTGHLKGYIAVINPTIAAATGQVAIIGITGGTPTTLAHTTTALTYTAGDVWTFAAFGSCLTVYQNGVRRVYIGDTSYTGGTWGVEVQPNGTTLNTAQVSSFRGYNAINQDGVWTKQGIVLAANADEVANGGGVGTGITGIGSMSFGPAQILTGNVYRGYCTNHTGLLYVESSDGINWTRYVSNPILAYNNEAGVFFYNGTFYWWGQAIAASGSGQIFYSTSANGLTWAAPVATNVTPGAGGYPANMYPFVTFDVISGNFQAVFGSLGGSGGQATLYLATAPVGTPGTWTLQNGGSAVATGLFPGLQPIKIGTTYYLWATTNQPGQGNASSPNFDPLESIVYSSTNGLTWTKVQHSMHNTQPFESLNNTNSGSFPTSIIQQGNKVAMYYEGSPGDSTGPQVYQCALAYAPTGSTIAQLTTNPEDGTVQLNTDSFAGGALSGNWTTITGLQTFAVSSGKCQPNGTGHGCGNYYSGGTFTANQYSEITIATLNSGASLTPTVRTQSGANSFYYATYQVAGSAGTATIGKQVAGSDTTLYTQSGNNMTLQVGDVIRLMVITGSDGFPQLFLFQNGFQIAQCADYGNAFTTGSPGINGSTTTLATDAQISLWAGGNANSLPAFGSGGGGAGGMNILWQSQHVNSMQNSGVY